MDLFLNADKTRKTPIVLYAFMLSILFFVIFGVLYALLVEPLYQLIQIPGNDPLSTAIHCLIISLLGSAICCLFFLLKDKRTVPAAFAFAAILVSIIFAASFRMEPESQAVLLPMLSLYALAPVITGNILSWILYLIIRRKQKTKKPASYTQKPNEGR